MRILIVDDNQFILEVIQKMLSDEPHELFTENNVDDAISFIESNENCDLVITDIVMPEKDGTKLAQYVKKHSPSIPVLAITGGVENAVEDYAIYAEMFADEVLKKPLKKDELIETINRLGV